MASTETTSRSLFRRFFEWALHGTYRHFFCWVPPKLGFLTSWWMRLFFRGIQVSNTQTRRLKALQDQGTIIYTTKYKSRFDFFFYHSRYQQLGLPFPEIGLDYRIVLMQPFRRLLQVTLANVIYFFKHFSLPDPYESGYIRDQLLAGKSGFVSLIEKRGFDRRFLKAKTDPLQYLIQLQKEQNRPIFIVPQKIFFSRKPNRTIPSMVDMLFGSEERPGRLRRVVTLFRNPGKVFSELAEPLSLQNVLASPDCRDLDTQTQAQHLRRQLVQRSNRLRQSTLGPVIKTQEELKQNILTSPRLEKFMQHHAKSRNVSLYSIHRKASKALDEIMAKYNMVVIRAADFCIHWIIKHMFDGVSYQPEEIEELKSKAQKAPLVLIPCHKSHIDYLIISYVLFHNHVAVPFVAAGANLSFFPMGPIFRGGGAFFIRRTFRGAVLYAKVFSEYIYWLLNEGYNIEFFIEGGRSRTGKLILPKLGLLSILLNAYKEGASEDLFFVPIFIGYDRVLEESAYLHELEGGKKEPESFRQMLKIPRLTKKRHGRIYLNVDSPISLNELLSKWGGAIEDMPSKELNAFCRNLGHRVIHAINAVSVVTPFALVASAILNRPKDRFSETSLRHHIDTYMAYLFSQQARLSDTLLMDHHRTVEQVLEAYVQRKFIEHGTAEKKKKKKKGLRHGWYAINESKRPHLEYYKNNSISFFVPAAYTAMTILEIDAFQFGASDIYDGYRNLQDLFKNEFAYDVDKTAEQYVRKTIKSFIDDAILIPHPTLPDRYNITSSGYRKLKFFAFFLKPYLESYWAALYAFSRYPQKKFSGKDRLKKIQSIGTRMYKRREIELKESNSKINYANAVDFFVSRGIRGSESREKITPYSEAIQRYLTLL
ncbi:Glycerol-3-phosphate acyltransferase (EC [Olavius algarvensis associated proteobacterium Delta 3]|nr:Glycerol-3-phosphate acyltransferase (EC [Olavius algarvensis associated proteobacterium Delta 3]CAB5119851.1 Glycerol-3-phosphate acyltransferase (EC [Olavius algarvensis associated proteobacterium Delta 3]